MTKHGIWGACYRRGPKVGSSFLGPFCLNIECTAAMSVSTAVILFGRSTEVVFRPSVSLDTFGQGGYDSRVSRSISLIEG